MSNYLVNVPSHSKKLQNESGKSLHQINLDNGRKHDCHSTFMLYWTTQHYIYIQDCIEDKPMQCAQINRVAAITLGRTGSCICEKIIIPQYGLISNT